MTVVSPTLVTATSQGHSLLAGLMFDPTGPLSSRGGVIAGLGLTKTAGMTWSLGTGRGAVQITSSVDGGTPPFAVTAAETGTFTDGDALKDRIDSVIAVLDEGTGTIAIQTLTGTLPPSGPPVAPPLPADAELLWSVLIPAGTSVGSGGWNVGNLTDRRRWAGIGANVGDIKFNAGATAPNGWLIPSGQLLSRTIYAELFAWFGTTHGAGDGSTTFGLPDLRGRGAVGVKAGDPNFGAIGAAPGAATHTHPLGDAGQAQVRVGTIGSNDGVHTRQVVAASAFTPNAFRTATGGVASGTSTGMAALQGSTDAASTIQPSLTLTPLIKT